MGRSYSARRQAQGKRHISLNARGLSRNTCRVAAMAHQGLRMQPSFLAGRTLGHNPGRVDAAIALQQARWLRCLPDPQTRFAQGACADRFAVEALRAGAPELVNIALRGWSRGVDCRRAGSATATVSAMAMRHCYWWGATSTAAWFQRVTSCDARTGSSRSGIATVPTARTPRPCRHRRSQHRANAPGCDADVEARRW